MARFRAIAVSASEVAESARREVVMALSDRNAGIDCRRLGAHAPALCKHTCRAHTRIPTRTYARKNVPLFALLNFADRSSLP
jgi:hypothetical protein